MGTYAHLVSTTVRSPEASWHVVAALGLGVAVLSLVIQVILWKKSGPLIKVKGQPATVMGSNGPSGGSCLTLSAINYGRRSAWVRGWGFLIDGSKYGLVSEWRYGTPVSEPIESRTFWAIDRLETRVLTARHHPTPLHYWRVRAYVITDRDKKIKSRKRMLVYEPGWTGPGEQPHSWWRWRRVTAMPFPQDMALRPDQ